MSAAEIIELIKKLPPEEKAVVIAFARETNPENPSTPKVANDEFDRAAKRVFAENEELLRRLAQ